METSFGKYLGSFNIPHSLATLAHDGRRSAYFRKELLNALQIIEEGHIAAADMKGSWAGAMGQSQFMPSSFLNFAEDWDGDGRRDIWGTTEDVFASAANYLQKAGWRDDITWGRQVKIPGDLVIDGKGATRLFDSKTKLTLPEWQKAGVRNVDGTDLPSRALSARLILPKASPVLLSSPTAITRSILRWNRSTTMRWRSGCSPTRFAREGVMLESLTKSTGIAVRVGALGLALAGCATAELAIDLVKKTQKEQETVKQAEELAAGTVVADPRYKIGDPYNVGGVWYYPKRDLTYDETGIGSWYGDEFAGRLTAYGEIFDPEKITAAHKTLPMPSVVRVTNLDNGKSLVVRVNDRGPFVAGRIIDLSRESARLLGFKDQGIAKVRVKILAEQSLRLEDLAKKGAFPQVEGVAETPMPEFNAVGTSSVTFAAKSNSGRSNYASEDGQSAIELLAGNRVGEVMNVPPIQTSIWVQVGAFHSETNATNVLNKIDRVGQGRVSRINRDGQVLHRVRLGPINEVGDADKLLSAVFELGFKGARIVVD